MGGSSHGSSTPPPAFSLRLPCSFTHDEHIRGRGESRWPTPDLESFKLFASFRPWLFHCRKNQLHPVVSACLRLDATASLGVFQIQSMQTRVFLVENSKCPGV